MDMLRLRHLFAIASHRFLVLSDPDLSCDPEAVLKLLIQSSEVSIKQFKKQLVLLCQDQRNGKLSGLGLAYDYFLKSNRHDLTKLIRSCFSKNLATRFLAPVDALNGQLTELKKVAKEIGCTKKNDSLHENFGLPLSVAYGLLSQNPQTIQWCLSSFFEYSAPLPSFDPQLSKIDLKTQICGTNLYSQHVCALFHRPNGLCNYKNEAINLFWTICEEPENNIRKELLKCVFAMPEEKISLLHLSVFLRQACKTMLEQSKTSTTTILNQYIQDILNEMSQKPLSLECMGEIVLCLLDAMKETKPSYSLENVEFLSAFASAIKIPPLEVSSLPSDQRLEYQALLALWEFPKKMLPSLPQDLDHIENISQLSPLAKTVLERFLMKQNAPVSPQKQKTRKM